jgi:hypothetical protein
MRPRVRSAGPRLVLHDARTVDDAREAPGHRRDHAGDGREQEHGRDGELDAMGDGVGVKDGWHGKHVRWERSA